MVTERRIGRRIARSGLTAVWRETRGRVRKKVTVHHAEVIDISMTGMLVETGSLVASGQRLDVEIDGHPARVQVMRAEHSTDGERHRYGMLLHTVSAELEAVIRSITTRLADRDRLATWLSRD
jgi:hypothetical protein